MDLAITTIRRTDGDFVYQSVLSLIAASNPFERIHLFVGDPDSSHVDFLGDCPRFTIHRLAPGDWRRIEGRSLGQRWAFNYWRCLNHFAERGEGVVLAEDDVWYDPKFGPFCREVVAEAEALGPDYILALYSSRDYADHLDRHRGCLLSVAVPDTFFGTQAMFYPAQSIAEITELMRSEALDGDTPCDVLIAHWARRRENLLVSTISLVQHLGWQSTGLGYWHDSPSFGRPWPARLGT